MIRCWLYRKAISFGLEEESPFAARIRGHLVSCPSCRQFHEADAALVCRLRREAVAVRVQPSPFLAARIVAGARRAEAARQPLRAGLLAWGVPAVLVALGVLCGVVVWQPRTPLAPAAQATVRVTLPGLDFALPDGERLLKMSEALDGPLGGELQLVMSDARTAVQALAQSFLPKGTE